MDGERSKTGCPLSPIRFNLVIADMEEEMGKVKWRGVKVGGRRVYTLAYADDVVLLAEDEDQLRSMLERLEEYMKRKNLEMNVGKSKIMRFRKGRRREVKRSWRWQGR